MKKILVIDIGGTSIKIRATGRRKPVKIPSGPTLTAKHLVHIVQKAVTGWDYSAISIGYPGPVRRGRPESNPKNLGRGWVGFDFRKAFKRPVRVINDAAMQALGCYKGGRMLFLGLGTGLGTTMIVDGVVIPMELAHLPYKRGRTYEEYVGKGGLRRLGRQKWRRHVADVTARLRAALKVDYVVIGGGNAKLIGRMPAWVTRGNNANAFVGGYRLWSRS